MKLLLLFVFVLALASCKSKDSKEKEVTTDTTTATPATDTASTASNTVTKKLTFQRYEEGDYPHLVFDDPETKESFDFGHPTENVLGGTNLVIADTSTAFGFRQNGQAVGKSFTVTMIKKTVDGYDGNGQPMKVEGWRITNITQ